MTMEHKTALPGTVSGRVMIPASKSLCHRAIICAALAEGDSTLRHISWSKDIEATVVAMERLGAIIWRDGDTLTVRGIGGKTVKGRMERIFCGESGSTVRFLIPIAGVLGVRTLFTGLGQLPKRPLDVYTDLMDAHGFDYEKESDGHLPLLIKSQWTSGTYQVRGDISSQFITGLLLALPMAEGDSVIEITTKLESKPYVDLTLDTLKQFGIEIIQDNEHRYRIPGGQSYHAGKVFIESDDSQAAVFLAAGAFAGEEEGLILDGLNPHTSQGDRMMLDFLRDMQVKTEWLSDGGLKVYPAENLTNITLNVEQCPDIVPALAAIGAFGKGTMRITGAARLRLKESDRLAAVSTEFRKMGVEISETEDGLIIKGEPDGLYEGGEASGWNDHRIVTALSILALRTFRGIGITGAESVSKSWPTYWEDYEQIGGGVDE